ncbi:MAG: hypothetical protein KAG80_10040 [Nocardioides sp.]|nr:hypothetical protein [Nocardioides sp.]
MSKLNNPAGRLHELLTAFEEHAGSNTTINSAWCEALRVEPAELLPMLGEVAALLGDVREAVKRSGRSELQDLHDEFAAQWAVPIFTHGRNPSGDRGNGQSGGLVDRAALVALGALAINFELVEPDGNIPDEEARAALTSGLSDLLEQVASDTELSADLRAAISTRLHDILWAIDHVTIVGPDGVEAAVERLVGQALIFTAGDQRSRSSGVFRRTLETAARVWSAFRAPGETREAIEGWQSILELLPPS